VGLISAELEPGALVTSQHLPDHLDDSTDLLIFNSHFQKHRGDDLYWSNNPGLAPELADSLRARYPKVRAIGFDFISATSYTQRDIGREAHQRFLCPERGHPILIIEDMNLSPLQSTTQIISCHVAPLLISGADGVPVTVTAELL
jgi:kynurenine formamidase